MTSFFHIKYYVSCLTDFIILKAIYILQQASWYSKIHSFPVKIIFKLLHKTRTS